MGGGQGKGDPAAGSATSAQGQQILKTPPGEVLRGRTTEELRPQALARPAQPYPISLTVHKFKDKNIKN